jgi:hypothetical protein
MEWYPYGDIIGPWNIHREETRQQEHAWSTRRSHYLSSLLSRGDAHGWRAPHAARIRSTAVRMPLATLVQASDWSCQELIGLASLGRACNFANGAPSQST